MWTVIISILAVFILFFIIIMIVDGNRFVIREYTIESDKIADDIKLAVCADLHNKQYGRNNIKLLHAVDRIQPDVILTAGDMLTAKPGKSFEAAAGFMECLAQEYPVCYGIGNHEYRMKIYPEDYGDSYERYIRRLKKAGITVLDNESIKVPVTGAGNNGARCDQNKIGNLKNEKWLRITGVSIERRYYKRFRKIEMEEQYLESQVGKPDQDSYQILLAHNPEYFEEYAKWGADLVLSGHIHGGIMRLPVLGGVISPKLVLFPKYDGGLFKQNASVMVLSRGLGMHTLPIRIFNPGELVVIHLKSCKSK